jgi:hypothetical protein
LGLFYGIKSSHRAKQAGESGCQSSQDQICEEVEPENCRDEISFIDSDELEPHEVLSGTITTCGNYPK